MVFSFMKSDSLPTSASPISAFGKCCRQLVSQAARKAPDDQKLCPWPVVDDNNYERHLGCSSSKDINHRVFRYFDENGDGKISAAELQRRLRTLSEEEAEMAVRSSDSDGDGMLGLEDFAKLMEAGEEEDKIQELMEAFGMYSNTTATAAATKTSEMTAFGCITPESLKRMLSQLGQSTQVEECKGMIERFDQNGDGVLDFEEFRTMMG